MLENPTLYYLFNQLQHTSAFEIAEQFSHLLKDEQKVRISLKVQGVSDWNGRK